MSTLVLGLILFLGVHSISIVNEPWRNRMADQLGMMTWKGGYTVVAVIGLLLIIYGYGSARYEPIMVYAPPVWLRYLAFLLLLPVFPLLLGAYLPGRIKATVKHPMILAVKLWALAHLLANGALADMLLFGGFLAWAVAERVSLKRRASRPIPGAPESGRNDVVAVVGGLVLYGLFIVWLHPVLIGVPVI